MLKKEAERSERIVMTRSSSGFESRPSDAESRYPELAGILEAFRQQGATGSSVDFVFIGDKARKYRARLQLGATDEVYASVEAIEASVPLGLTLRELDVTSLMCIGLSYAEIATALHLSLSTVTTHAEHIFTKLSTRNRTEAVVIAVQHGAIRLPLPASVKSTSLIGRLDTLSRHVTASDWHAELTRSTAASSANERNKRSIRIGHIYPLNDEEGQEMLFGAQLAVEDVNANGGVCGRSLELVAVGVNVSSLEQIKQATETMFNENIDALSFGYADPRESLPELLGFWRETELPVLHSLTSRLACEIVTTETGYDNVFQFCPSDDSYGDEFLRFVKRVAQSRYSERDSRDIIMVTDDPHLANYAEIWAARALTLGYDLTLLRASDEFEAAAAANVVSRISPAIAYLALFRASTLRAFLRRFMLRPSPSLLYGLWAPGTSDFRNDLKECEGLIWSTATGRYDDLFGKRFEADFERRYGRQVFGTSASIQYDSVGVLAHAWQRSGRPDSYRATAKELRTLVHRGVNGSYFFGAEHQRPLTYGVDSRDASLSQAHLVYQVQDGVNRIIAPAPYASSRYRPQPWLLNTTPA